MTEEILSAVDGQLFAVWFLIGAALVFWMQAGFAMVETGFTRAKNDGNILMKNLMDFCIGTVVFILIGFGLLLGEDVVGLIGKPGLDIFTSYENFDYSNFVFNLVFCATTATIVSGAMAERTKFLSYCIYSGVISALIYPIEAHWIWGGGWLSQLGFHDFAGSCAIHMVGGISALIGAKFLGPRIGKFTKDKDGNIIAGFYASRTHSIIPVKDCMLGVAENREILDAILSYMRECHIEPYDETTGRGLVRHALIRYGFTTKEVMVCLVINGRKLPAQNVLVEKLQVISGMTSISININQKNTNVILGEQTETIWGQSYITDYIHLRDCMNFERTGKAISYHISPQSFYQVNPEQTEKLYSLALEYAGLTGKESVWDLYCGIGTISLFLAGKAGHVYGVEIVPQAIADAKDNAKRNGFSNTEFFVGKAEEVLPEFYAKHKNEKTDMLHPDVIVVDPPRKGCDEKCLETMLLMKPERIVYVSCDSATLARDLNVLAEGGYEVKRVRAVDQFAHTTHIETCVLLQRRTM